MVMSPAARRRPTTASRATARTAAARAIRRRAGILFTGPPLQRFASRVATGDADDMVGAAAERDVLVGAHLVDLGIDGTGVAGGGDFAGARVVEERRRV